MCKLVNNFISKPCKKHIFSISPPQSAFAFLFPLLLFLPTCVTFPSPLPFSSPPPSPITHPESVSAHRPKKIE